jgi:hypothetical protein
MAPAETGKEDRAGDLEVPGEHLCDLKIFDEGALVTMT